MKKLYRSKTDRMIGGVCAGLAKNMNLDVSLVRVLTAVLALFTSGVVLVAYIVAWVVIPEEGGASGAENLYQRYNEYRQQPPQGPSPTPPAAEETFNPYQDEDPQN